MDILFIFLTNNIMLREYFMQEMGILDKINWITILFRNFPAATIILAIYTGLILGYLTKI